MLHVLRRKLVGWLRGVASQRQLDLVMSAVVRVSEGSGALLPPPRAAPPRWAYLGAAGEGRANLGRFTVHSRRARPPAAAAWAAEAVPLMAREAEGAVVFDVQVMQLTLMAAHPQALKHEVAEMEEVRRMFGDVAMQARRSRLHLAYISPTSRLHLPYISPASPRDVAMQACLTDHAAHREVYTLVGRAHAIAYWDIDPSMAVLEHWRAYYPQAQSHQYLPCICPISPLPLEHRRASYPRSSSPRRRRGCPPCSSRCARPT